MEFPSWRLLSFLFLLLIASSGSDRVELIRCAEQPWCLDNVNGETLKVIREHMYNETDPCENFWDYACGSWTEGPYYDHVDTFGAMTNYYADQLIDMLQVLQTSPKDFDEISSLMLNKIWKYFQVCRTSGKYYLEMSNYLREIPMPQIFGDNFHWMKLFSKTSPIWESHDWLQLSSVLRSYGFHGVFFEESAGFASNDSSRYVMEVRIPQAQKRFQSKYKIFEILEEFQFERFAPSDALWQLAQDIYAFDKEIVELYRRYEESGNNMKIMNLQQLKTNEPFIDWQKYFDLLAGNPLDPHGLTIEMSGKLEYFKDLQMHLKQKDTQIITWYILLNFLKYLLDVKPLITDRECLLHTNVMFPLGVNYIYNRFLYRNRDKDEMVLLNIFQKLKGQFSLYLQQNKFHLEEEELQYLQKKLSTVQMRIGNLPFQLPPLSDYYTSTEISEDNFYKNHMQMLKFRFLQQHKVNFKPNASHPNLGEYYVNDDISKLRNAPYFVHPRNLLIMPMVFLQLPFYHHSQHSLLQYSLVGWIMAHELSHAFDSYGLNFDSQGNYSPLGHRISHKLSFLKTMECLSENTATLSVNERMADVNGLQLVWDFYSRNFLDSKDLGFQKLFFINFAQFFCGSLPPTTAHDLDNVRVKESLVNLREFSRIFNCSKNDKHSARDICDVWRV